MLNFMQLERMGTEVVVEDVRLTSDDVKRGVEFGAVQARTGELISSGAFVPDVVADDTYGRVGWCGEAEVA